MLPHDGYEGKIILRRQTGVTVAAMLFRFSNLATIRFALKLAFKSLRSMIGTMSLDSFI